MGLSKPILIGQLRSFLRQRRLTFAFALSQFCRIGPRSRTVDYRQRQGDRSGVSAQVGRRGLSRELEKAGRVLFKNERAHLVLDLDLVEVGQPALRTDHWPVGTEKHLLLEKRVAVLEENLRKILWRPARQVDVDVRLVVGHGERLLLPRGRRVRD